MRFLNKIALWCLYFTIHTNCLFSQDTIFVKSKDTLLVRVLEISKTEVSYKVFYNPDGVIYKVNNNLVSKIIYENGKEEPRFQSNKPLTQNPLVNFQSKLFVVEGKHIIYNNNDILHKDALKIMMKSNPNLNSDEFNQTLLEIEGKKNAQITFVVLAPVFGLGGFYLARRNYYGPNDAPKAKAYIFSGIGLCVSSVVTSQIYKAIKNKQIRKAALLYNSEIL